jgi:hypothetical protein
MIYELTNQHLSHLPRVMLYLVTIRNLHDQLRIGDKVVNFKQVQSRQVNEIFLRFYRDRGLLQMISRYFINHRLDEDGESGGGAGDMDMLRDFAAMMEALEAKADSIEKITLPADFDPQEAGKVRDKMRVTIGGIGQDVFVHIEKTNPDLLAQCSQFAIDKAESFAKKVNQQVASELKAELPFKKSHAQALVASAVHKVTQQPSTAPSLTS